MTQTYDFEQDDERLVDAAVGALTPAIRRNLFFVPRTLPRSPFTPFSSLETFCSEIEAAAQASVRLSRTLGLLYLRAPSADESELEKACRDMKRAVRQTDHIARVGGEFVVCISLLKSMTDLKNIGVRLIERSGFKNLIAESAEARHVGAAIYPLDGYQGADLIASAQRHWRALGQDGGADGELTPLLTAFQRGEDVPHEIGPHVDYASLTTARNDLARQLNVDPESITITIKV